MKNTFLFIAITLLTIDNVGGGTDTFVSDNDLVDDIVLVHNVDSQITLICMETATNTYKWVQISK